MSLAPDLRVRETLTRARADAITRVSHYLREGRPDARRELVEAATQYALALAEAIDWFDKHMNENPYRPTT